jgi:hypothetical protein
MEELVRSMIVLENCPLNFECGEKIIMSCEQFFVKAPLKIFAQCILNLVEKNDVENVVFKHVFNTQGEPNHVGDYFPATLVVCHPMFIRFWHFMKTPRFVFKREQCLPNGIFVCDKIPEGQMFSRIIVMKTRVDWLFNKQRPIVWEWLDQRETSKGICATFNGDYPPLPSLTLLKMKSCYPYKFLEDFQCCVCYGKSNGIVYKCTHHICDSCHNNWKTKCSTCPMCRAQTEIDFVCEKPKGLLHTLEQFARLRKDGELWYIDSRLLQEIGNIENCWILNEIKKRRIFEFDDVFCKNTGGHIFAKELFFKISKFFFFNVTGNVCKFFLHEFGDVVIFYNQEKNVDYEKVCRKWMESVRLDY